MSLHRPRPASRGSATLPPRPGSAGLPCFPWVTPWDPGCGCAPADGPGRDWPLRTAASEDGVCGPLADGDHGTAPSETGTPTSAAPERAGTAPTEGGQCAGRGEQRLRWATSQPPAHPRSQRGSPPQDFRRGRRSGPPAGCVHSANRGGNPPAGKRPSEFGSCGSPPQPPKPSGGPCLRPPSGAGACDRSPPTPTNACPAAEGEGGPR